MNNYILDNTNGYGDVTRLTSANCGTPWSGSYTQIVYGPGGDKLALMNAQSLVKAFVPLNGGATAVYTSAGLDHYRHSDWLGSNRLSSTPSRTVQWSGAYAPWGELYASSPSGSSDPSFTGQNS